MSLANTTTGKLCKTRIAPTPSGYLHAGNALSFAITAAIAAKENAAILLRIDDIDRQRVRPEYIQDIFQSLEFLGISYSEGPTSINDFTENFSQLLRCRLYENALEKLKQKNCLFACTCSRTAMGRLSANEQNCECFYKHLPLDTPGVNLRFKTDLLQQLTYTEWPDKIITATLPASMHNFIVWKKDGYPSYQLASVVDDRLFNINLIVRGKDLWPSTLAQLMLAHYLKDNGFLKSRFYHHQLLTGSGGEKLSKTAGDISLQHYKNQGLSARQVYNTILQMCGYTESVENAVELGNLLLNKAYRQ